VTTAIIVIVVVVILLLFFAAGIRIVRPTHRGLVERLGKYNRYANPGFHWIIPVVERSCSSTRSLR
jgi:regulator of protease activity HflC (stomatin/prohibitin superfamily)